MRLNKVTRKQLATGKPTTFPWPDSDIVPRKGRRYKLSTDSGTAAQREFEVLSVSEENGTFTVVGRLHDDPVRLLGRRGGYTDKPSAAIGSTDRQHRGTLWEEPEAVDEVTQRRLTHEARAREREAAGELLAAAEELRSALKDRIESSPEFMQMAGRDVWLIRSKLDRLVKNTKRRAA